MSAPFEARGEFRCFLGRSGFESWFGWIGLGQVGSVFFGSGFKSWFRGWMGFSLVKGLGFST